LTTLSAISASLRTSGEAPTASSPPPVAGPITGGVFTITSAGAWTTFMRMVAS
jgi:hypothetical protein